MSRRLKLLALLSTLAMLAAVGCKKDEKGAEGKDTPETGKTTDTPDKPKDPPKAKMVEMALPKTGLAMMLPEGASVDEAIMAGADQITLPGVKSKMVVRPRGSDKDLDGHVEWAKGHQIQKFTKELLKEGSGTAFTYIHAVEMGGQPKAVFIQRFQLGDKDLVCFANADNEAAAMAMKAACATAKVAGGAAPAGDADDDGAAPKKGAAAPTKDKAKAPAKAKDKDKDKGGW